MIPSHALRFLPRLYGTRKGLNIISPLLPTPAPVSRIRHAMPCHINSDSSELRVFILKSDVSITIMYHGVCPNFSAADVRSKFPYNLCQYDEWIEGVPSPQTSSSLFPA